MGRFLTTLFEGLMGNPGENGIFSCSENDTEIDDFGFSRKKTFFVIFDKIVIFEKKRKMEIPKKHEKSCFRGVKPLKDMMIDSTQSGGYHDGNAPILPLG